jgi:UDP-glucose 4-epimerase
MRILVTGGSGFIGSHLVEALADAGHEVDVLDVRKPELAKPDAVREWIGKDIRSDLTNVIKGYDAVYHLASIANARVCGLRPRDAWDINVMGTYNVVEACRVNNVPRLLYASSTWMAGLQVGEEVAELNPFEIHKMNTVYGATKLAGELMIYASHSESGGPDYTIMRYGIPYGEGMWDGLVVRAFMFQAERFKTISIFGDGLQGRNFLYVKDMCDAQVALLDKKGKNKVYNLGSEKFVPIRLVAEEVVKHIPAKVSYITQARVEPKLRNVSSEAMAKDFGWTPKTGFEDGIKRCVTWWHGLSPDLKDEVPYYVP